MTARTRIFSLTGRLLPAIGMVHQHFTLVLSLMVSRNITLGLKEKGYPFPNRNKTGQTVAEISTAGPPPHFLRQRL